MILCRTCLSFAEPVSFPLLQLLVLNLSSSFQQGAVTTIQIWPSICPSGRNGQGLAQSCPCHRSGRSPSPSPKLDPSPHQVRTRPLTDLDLHSTRARPPPHPSPSQAGTLSRQRHESVTARHLPKRSAFLGML